MNQKQLHDTHIKPLIDVMNANGYHYLVIAGKDEICSRYMKGDYRDTKGMIIGMMENNPNIKEMIIDIVNDLK